MGLNHCVHDGWVVGATEAFAADEHEFCGEGLPLKVGCGNLVCVMCRTKVRSAPGLRPRGRVSAADLHALPEWRPGDPLEAEPPPIVDRLYACRCTAWCGSSDHRMREPDPEPEDPRFPWKCGGHPPVSLPYVLDGVRLTEDTDFRELVRRTTLRWAPEGARHLERAIWGGWGFKLYVRLLGTPWAEHVSRAAADMLLDPEADVRSGAVAFLERFPLSPGAERLVEAYRDHLRLFGDQDPVPEMGTLRDRLVAALASRLQRIREHGEFEPELLSILREEAFRSGNRDVVLGVLNDVDPDWLVEHAGECCAADPDRWKDLLLGLEAAESRQMAEATRRILASGAVDKDKLVRWARRALDWAAFDDVKAGLQPSAPAPQASGRRRR